MRVHVIQHTPFGSPCHIESWAAQRGLRLTYSRLHQQDSLPSLRDFDALILMGGPMSVHDEKQHPWLKNEKRLVESALASEKKILGICLGAQIIAQVLGSKVRKNTGPEIGWHPIRLTTDGRRSPVLNGFPSEPFDVLHWHHDTYTLPSAAVNLASSDLTANQAFQYGPNVFGMQFHLEACAEKISKMCEVTDFARYMHSPYVQAKEWIQKKSVMAFQLQPLFYSFMDGFTEMSAMAEAESAPA
jgi:GMP synthase-like glutamine amidotransferase